MQFSANELGVINFSLQTQPDPNSKQGIVQRNFAIDKLKMAVDVHEKIQSLTKEEADKKIFVDGEIDFTTSEKAFLIELMKRNWGVEDGKIYLGLKERLEK